MAMMASNGAVEGPESEDDAGWVVEAGTLRSVRKPEERSSLADGATALLLWVED